MNRPEGLKVAALGEREILMTREFDAPMNLVFDAFTKPELIRRWLLGPDGWVMTICDVDLKVGGRYRYFWKHEKNGHSMGMGGDFREIAAPKRLVTTELFDEAWYPGEAVCSLDLIEQGGRTSMRQMVTYATREARDGVIKSPMESGMQAGYARLDSVLATLAAQV